MNGERRAPALPGMGGIDDEGAAATLVRGVAQIDQYPLGGVDVVLVGAVPVEIVLVVGAADVEPAAGAVRLARAGDGAEHVVQEAERVRRTGGHLHRGG